MSNQSQGAVLANQPVAVTAGSGITIDPSTGVISVNAATISGVMKLNNGSAYNAYQWPNNPGTAGQFLQTNGAGLVDWADVQGFAVVTVSGSAPTPSDVGELWFDCLNGTLNVYQNCVGSPSPNWFNVAQPGFPVLPGNTSSSVAWTGSGTQASPYQMTVTTTASGSAVQIINTVTIVGLAPFQYVPIVDLNAVANGGRFSFTNNYADAGGQLVFDTVFTDQPPSGSGVIYNAAIKVGYGTVYINAQVTVVAALVVTGGSISGPLYVGQQLTYTPGVPSGGSTPYGSPTIKWFANGTLIPSATGLTYQLTTNELNKQITASTTYTDNSSQTATGTSAAVGPVLAAPAALTITSPGSISPATNVVVGNTLNYTAGTFTGGIPTVTPSWKWQRNGTDISGIAANATSYVTVSADSGQAITVRYQVQDSATPTPVTQFASTTAVTPTSPFPGGVWAPTPAGAMNNNNPGTSSGLWNGANGATITATGCAEVSTDGTNFFPSLTVNIGQTLYQRWKQTALCGLNDSGQTIQGSVSDGTYTNFYSLQINRVPSAPPSFTAATGAPGAAVDSNSQTISGMNSTTYITYDASSTGDSTTYFAIINGGSPQAIPAAPSTLLTIQSGDTLVLRQTASSTPATARNLVINIGDADGNPRQQATYTLTAVSTPFSGVTFSPAAGPNAGPETVNGVTGGGTLGTLNGKASASWTPVTTALTGTNIRMQVNGTGGYSTSATAVNGQSLEIAWVTGYLDTITNGNNATGSFTGTISGTTYTNTFSFQVKRTADFTVTSGPASGASGAITLVSQTPNNYNVPLKVYQNVPSGNALTSVTVDINSTGPVLLPTTPGSALTINPGQTIVFTATAPGTPATYTTDIVIGDTTKTWSYQVTVTPTVSTPSINNPTAGTTVNPALNSPAGITVTTPASGTLGGFQTNYGGTQVDSIWNVYKGGPGPTFQSTNTISTVTTTAPTLGASYGGGYFGGQINDGGTVYNLVVAPAGSGTSNKQWKTSDSGDGATFQNFTYGKPANDAGNDSNHPAFQWARSLNIGGYTDWYIPAVNELEVLYYFFKPTGTNNATGMRIFGGNIGENPAAVSPEPVNTAYSTTSPGPTSVSIFQSGGSQAFTPSNYYWTATENPGNDAQGVWQFFNNGNQNINTKSTSLSVRAIRRANSTGLGSNQVLSIVGADTDGFAVGMAIKGSSSGATGTITAIDGTTVTVTLTSSTNFSNTDKLQGNGSAVTGFPLTKTTAPLNEAFVPQANLTTSSKYYASVTFTGSPSGGSPVVSLPSAWSDFSTVSSFVLSPGEAYAGGYFGGQVNISGTIYNLVVAPTTAGSLTGFNANVKYGVSGTGLNSTAQNSNYGLPITTTFASSDFPMFDWCVNSSTGPNAGTFDATNTAGTGIGGYNDWYIPAFNELITLYYFLKPTTDPNNAGGYGINPIAVSPQPVNTAYTLTNPAQTTSLLFRGAQGFSAGGAVYHWTATASQVDFNFPNRAGIMWFQDGYSETGSDTRSNYMARAIRRVQA